MANVKNNYRKNIKVFGNFKKVGYWSVVAERVFYRHCKHEQKLTNVFPQPYITHSNFPVFNVLFGY